MRLPRALPIVLALLLLPSVSAGSERDPEIRDPQDRADWSPTDLLAAWFETEEDGLRFWIKTLDGGMPERFPDHVYWVSFRVRGEFVGATVGFANDGAIRGHLGDLDGPAWDRGGFERVANGRVIDLKEERGRPSKWSGLIPWGAVDGLEEGATLTNLAAGTAFYDRSARQWRGGLDVASTNEPYVVRASFFPILVPAWVIPSIVLVCTAGGLATGFTVARYRMKRRAAKNAPVATPVPVRSAPPPPGQRFQRAPPPRENQ